jgi:hypothetical protein
MTRKNFYLGALVLGAAVTLTLAVTLTVSISRSHRKPSPASSAPILAQATTPTAPESKGGQKELIKVHGHWTIDVRNPDGKLVTHREFENALTASGAENLSDFLARKGTVGEWAIEIKDFTTGPCLSDENDPTPFEPVPCGVVEATDATTNAFGFRSRFYTLTLSTPISIDANGNPVPGAPKRFMLSGTATAQRASQINHLTTYVVKCPQTGTCHGYPFTDVGLTAPVNGSCPPNTQCIVNVVAGQIIQVTVVISFS